jgi:hypothetical protein
MRLTIHAGLHKTGSTSIQVFCDVQKLCLEEAGIFYPGEFALNGAHHPFAKLVRDGKVEDVKKILSSWILSCRDRGIQRLLLSSEDFEYIGADGVDLIGDCASKLSVDFDALIYIRPQSDLIEAQYSQQIREGILLGSLTDFFQESIEYGDFIALESILDGFYARIGDSLQVAFYYNQFHQPINSVVDFAQRLSISAIREYTDPGTYKFNRRLSGNQLIFLKCLVADFPKIGQLDQYRRSQVLYRFIEDFDWPDSTKGGSSAKLTIDQLIICRDMFQESNRRISAKYLGNCNVIQYWYENRINSVQPFGDNVEHFSPSGGAEGCDLARAKELLAFIMASY